MMVSQLVVGLLAGAMLAGAAGAQAPVPENGGAEPPAFVVPAHDWKPGEVIEDADDLLVALETADLGITTFKADVRYTRVFALAGDEQVRDGALYFETVDRGDEQTPALRRFAVLFTSLRVGSRVEKEPKDYIFDGQYLVERLEKSRDFIKRRVVAPGERVDPLRIGEGPFPVPVGQRRSEVLERYEARLAPAAEGLEAESLVKFVTGAKESDGTWQLVLTPRVEAKKADEQTEIRVWYRRSDLLPRLAITTTLAGDVSIVQMLNPEKNPKQMPHRVFDTAVPARGWNVRLEEYSSEPAGE